MSNLFGGLTTEGLEETTDRLGGFQPQQSDIYAVTIKAAYAIKSAGGASGVVVLANLPNQQEYRETIYITNRKGENYYLNKNDQTKKVPLPGFTTIDDLCLCASGQPLSAQPTEEKTMNIYDSDEQKEVPKSVPVLIDLTGKTVLLAILRNLENKSKKDGSTYVATAETRETNTIDKVFDFDSKLTTVEARAGAEEPEFHDAWLERNKGNTKDRRTIKDGEGGTSGKPGSAPSSKGGTTPKKSLFGK